MAPVDAEETFVKIYGHEFNASDAANVALWLGQPCDFSPPPPPDPTCAHGIVGNLGKKQGTGTVCCAKECGVCAHPSSACTARPGGRVNCCPSDIGAANISCAVQAAPCVLTPPPDALTAPVGNAPASEAVDGKRWETIEQYQASVLLAAKPTLGRTEV
eukprot:COSAG02_NODE_687_length_18478_cov_23.093476_17_plen_159_part_00